MRAVRWIAVTVFCACALVSRVHGAGFVFATLDVPGATLTNAQGVNQQGDVVGFFVDAAGQQHGFLRSGGQYRTIDYPNGHAISARGINDDGDIVGSYQRPGESGGVPGHGFLLTRRGGLFAIDYPGHLNTIPQRILNDGTILGCYHDTDTMGTMHGMMFQRGFSAIDMGMSMHNGATPDTRHIVGLFMDDDGRNKAYVIDNGKFAAVEVPGALATSAWDLSASGVMVGDYTDATGAAHGFQYDHGAFGRIDVPDAATTRARGINSNGDIVGLYIDRAGRTHGFLAQVSR
jgi:probable HAF family extracellular repeat protein